MTTINKNFFIAPSTTGLGAMRWVATLLLAVMMLTTAQTAWATTTSTITNALIGVFGAIADGRYTLTSQTYTLTGDENTAGYIYVPSGVTATIDLNGHTIDRGLTSADNNGSVIIVAGTLTITDSGTDGKIQGGYDGYAEHGFYVSGVEVQNGATFNLQGGTLVGRNQDYDYTVAVDDNGSFTMTGGKITGGKNGVAAYGNVVLSGGEISGNNIGVRVSENISISGNPVITGNTVMNVDLRSSGGICKINITGALTDGANIGITVHNPTDNSPVTVTSGYNTYNSVSPDTYFSLDNDGQIQTSPFDYMTVVMGWNEDRTEIAVGTATRTVTFDMNGHGDAIDAVSLLSGYKVAQPTEPTADDWFFVDWFTDDACTTGNEWNFDNAVTSNMTLHAKWTQTAIHSINLPENMVIVSTDKEAVGGKYPVGTEIKFKLSSEDYVIDGDVKNGDDVLTADANGIYTVTMGDADITITATVKKAVEPNKTLSGSDNYTAQDGDVLTGSTCGTVTIADNAKITLSDVTITGGIVCEGTAEITLVGTNSVNGASQKAGIQVGGSGTTLTIKGNGSLTANGGGDSGGIGLSSAWDVDATGGDIVIEGGNITATGNGMGAGIGLGVAYDNSPRTITLGNITIKGGSVTATGGNQGKGIGTGYVYGLRNTSNIGVGTITITTGIDRVEASSISESITYMHGENDITANASDYFVFTNGGNRIFSSAKIIGNIAIATISDYVFTGSAIKPEPTVKSGSLSFAKGTDYEYSYSNNTNVGTAKVTVTFKGDYASLGSVEKEFTITKATPTVTAPTAIADLVYTGSAQALVTGGTTDVGDILSYCLEENGMYSADIPTGTNAGTYTVYYKVDGSDNWNAVAGGTVEVNIALALADAADNSNAITAHADKTLVVALSGCTLYKDGKWNTLCLPFDVDLTATDCPLYGATARSVTAASVSGTTLNLTFGDAVNTLEAGTPYIIKWDGDGTSNIENPVFEGVTIDATKNDYDTNAESVITDERVRFVGTYKSTPFDAENKSILLMGGENTLYYPAAGAGVGSFCAYFKIGDEGVLLARRLTSFSIDFGEGEEEATGIVEVEANTSLSTLHSSLKDAWHTLDGRRLQGKPTQGGIYINNGKKITVK